MKNLLKSVVLASGLLLASNAVNAQQKIGHINSQDVMASTTEFKNASAELQKLKAEKDKQLGDMFAEYQKKQTELNDKARNRSEANKETIDAEANKIVTEMRDMEGRLQQNQEAAEEELMKKQQELFRPIQEKVVNAINAVAKEKGYAYILDLASGAVAYFNGGDDLSADVKTKLGVSATAAPATTPAKK